MRYSFDPIWQPAWITALVGEDRCHLNGLAVVEGKPKYVSALAQTDSSGGWRALKGKSGVIIDVDTDAVVASRLAMPHSPRWHDSRLQILESGRGALCTVDLADGTVTTVAEMPGFTRGLAFIGVYAFVGLSQVRDSVFDSLPVTETSAERNCGVWIIDTRTGEVVGMLRFDGVVQEIFDVQVLPASWPALSVEGSDEPPPYLLPDAASH